jgi:hypothetical protein
VVAGVVLLMGVPGCGYSSASLYPERYGSVAVPIAENRTMQRDVEFQLTEALIKQVRDRTPYAIHTSAAVADTLIEATVLDVDRRTLFRTVDGGLPQELEVVVTADVVWRDLGTGRVIRELPGVQATGRFVPTTPIGEFYETAEQAAVVELARQVVDAMRSDW